MSLLQDIQDAAVDGAGDLGTVLRKCKLLAARLGSKPLEDWLLWESNGYPEEAPVPPYRVWSLELKGNFSGPFQSGIRNAPIPLLCLPEKARDHYEHFKCRQSVAAVESIVRDSKKDNGSGALHVSTGDLAVILGQKVYEGQNCVQAWAEFGKGHLIELLNAVRNRVLDFSLAVWKEDPNAGEISLSKTPTIKPAKLTQIFNTTVLGGSANLVGTAENTTFHLEIVANDFGSLAAALKKHDVSNRDLEKLEEAVRSDPSPTTPQKTGPKVSKWISNMIKKASDGTWEVGVGAAGSLLAQAIAKYYGF